MRTRSQISAWAQAQQQYLSGDAVAVSAPQPKTHPKKRKLRVAVAQTDTPGMHDTAVLTDLAATKKAILDYISPNAKKAKLHAEQQDTAKHEQQMHGLVLFKTPMKRPMLTVDTQPAPVKDDEAAKAQSILDYISPNSKQSKLNTQKIAPASGLTPEASRKRPHIRRSLTYASSDCVLSDSSVEDRTPQRLSPASSPRTNDRASMLQRIAGSCAAQKQLPVVGRTAEKDMIASVLYDDNDPQQQRKRSIFIVGPPGTGKSSSVKELLSDYERRCPRNAVIRLNCSTYTNPTALYAELDAQLRVHSPWMLPYLDPYLLDEFLQDVAARKPTKSESVLVLDELDQLLRMPPAMQKRVQEVLRFLVAWSELPASTFTFLGIMNGVDMHTQISSFLPKDHTVSHVLFPAYTYNDLLAILNAYVESAFAAADGREMNKLIEQRAIELIARKVASRDGDVRRAISLLQQCARFSLRRSTEAAAGNIADRFADEHLKITLRDVLACSSAALTAGPARDVYQLPRLPKILLYVITSIALSDGSKACDMTRVSQELAHLRATPAFAWMPLFKRDDLQAHLASLECYALVKRPARASTKLSFWKAKLTSAVTMDIVLRAMQDDPLLCMLAQQHK
uniref:AAA+ ATPase domain-containing protein n=1 Tax=Globisporangium ultimum (strain ATCC 200006 / CBS 805.95 / DAOM BR144) TaxID=431595 RepID=K3XA09_GLOUD